MLQNFFTALYKKTEMDKNTKIKELEKEVKRLKAENKKYEMFVENLKTILTPKDKFRTKI